jgi:hypothetical protein
LNRWIWRQSPRRLRPCGASVRPGRDNPAAAAAPVVAVRAARTDPAAGVRVAVHRAAGHPLVPRIRTRPDPKPPRRILGTRRDRATRRHKILTGAGVAAGAAVAVPPAARRIPARRVLRAILQRRRWQQNLRSPETAPRCRGIALRANAQCRRRGRTEAPSSCHQ